MTLTIQTFLIVCPLLFLAGLVDAIGGGGGLISLPAYLLSGVPIHNAIATNKMSSSMGTTIAAVRYGLAGFIPWKIAIFCVATAMIGSQLGAHLALLLSDRAFTIVMLVILPLTAWYVLRGKVLEDLLEEEYAEGRESFRHFAEAYGTGKNDRKTGVFFQCILWPFRPSRDSL